MFPPWCKKLKDSHTKYWPYNSHICIRECKTKKKKIGKRLFLDMRIYCLIGVVIALSVFDLSTNQHSKLGQHLVDLSWIEAI